MAGETILDCARSPLLRGVNLVEASAGTGKTYAIGMLVLRAVTEQAIPIDRILVVTFTKAATEELRTRIRQRLVEARMLLLGGSSTDATINTWVATVVDRKAALDRLRLALAQIDRAAIFTIHSFCRQMLTEQALESGQLFDVELLTDIEQARSQVVEDFWRSRLYRLAPRVCGIVIEKYSTPADLAKSIAAPGMVNARIEPDTSPFAEVAGQFESSCRLLAQWWGQHAGELGGYFFSARDNGQLKKDFAEDLDFWWQALADWLAGKDGGYPGRLDCLTRDGLKAVLNGNKVRKKRQDAFVAEWPLPEQLAVALAEAVGNVVLALRRELAGTLQSELQRRLVERGHMSFDDLIVRLDNALIDKDNGLQHILGERFSAALIDEFQDTDSAQWRIFSRLFGNGDHYLYLIGDPKQAIYRFRGADIHSYFEARNHADHQVTLSQNYRSHPLLVEEINTIFSQREDPFALGGGVLPFSPVSPAKTTGDGALVRNGKVLPVMVYCQLSTNPKSGPAWFSGKAAERFREYVISEVCRLLDRCDPVTLRTAKKGTVGERPLAARDIAVLVRSNRQADEYLQALARAGVPAVVGSKKSVFETGEARELLTLLSALAAPGDMLAVKRAMTISWFALSGNDLLTIWEDESAFDDRFNRILLYHQRWQEKGFLTMMNRLLDDEEVYLNLAGGDLAERRIANVHHLLELVQEAETDGKLGPDQTLVWLQSMIAGKSGEEDRELRLESDEEAVRIVTMHSAKGLQYPVVFCPVLWYRSDREYGADLVSCHEDDGPVVDLGSQEMERRRCQAVQEGLAEDLRLAYVALTRAELCCYTMWADVKRVAGSVASSHDSALGWLLYPEGVGDFDSQYRQLCAHAEGDGVEHRLVSATDDFQVEYHPMRDDVAILAPLSPGTRVLTTDYQLSSYSAMASLSEQEDHGAEVPGEEPAVPGPEILHPGLPAGPGFGNLIHDALESLPFSSLADGSSNEEQLAGLCRRYGLDLDGAAVQPLLATIVNTRLTADGEGFSLAELHGRNYVCEMPFYFQVNRLDTRKINEVLAGEPTVTQLSAKTMQGYLTGFIDLFCMHDTKYYLLDYKTNFLGNSMADYRPERLAVAMASHNYGLQYWIYSLVLHRYLQNMLPGYRYENHFGGVFYLFVRGMSAAIPGSGVFSTLPSADILARLAEAIGGSV